MRAISESSIALAITQDAIDLANFAFGLAAFTLGRFTGFFVELAAADFGKDSGLFTGLLKAAHEALHGFTLTGFDKWHG